MSNFESQSEEDESSVEDEIDLLLQITENVWIQCENLDCLKWRKVPKDYAAQFERGTSWFCHLNPDTDYDECTKPEENHVPYDKVAARAGIKFVFSQFELGDLVWAKTAGYCRWPAVITQDPDCGLYITQDIDGDPYAYHVEYLGNPHSRCWVMAKHVEIYGHRNGNFGKVTKEKPAAGNVKNKKKSMQGRRIAFSHKYKDRRHQNKVGDAVEEAESLLRMSRAARLQLMIYEYEHLISEHSDMNIMEKRGNKEIVTFKKQEGSAKPASTLKQKWPTRSRQGIETQLDQIVPEMCNNYVNHQNICTVNKCGIAHTSTLFGECTDTNLDLTQTEKPAKCRNTLKHIKGSRLTKRKWGKSKLERKDGNFKEKEAKTSVGQCKRNVTPVSSYTQECRDGGKKNDGPVFSGLQSAGLLEDTLYCTEDFDKIMQQLEETESQTSTTCTQANKDALDFNTMMKELDEDADVHHVSSNMDSGPSRQEDEFSMFEDIESNLSAMEGFFEEVLKEDVL